MKVKANPVEELARRVNEKSRELQNVQESVDSALRQVRELQEQESRLRLDAQRLDEEIKEKEASLTSVVERETAFLTSIQTEARRESDRLDELREEIVGLAREHRLLKPMVEEAKSFASKRDEYQTTYLKEKQKYEKAEISYAETLKDTETVLKKADARQKEVDSAKQYLTDFYGKVASYAKAAQATLEYVNSEFKRTGTPVRFRIPKGSIDGILEMTIDDL